MSLCHEAKAAQLWALKNQLTNETKGQSCRSDWW